jgi:hypothetical protein
VFRFENTPETPPGTAGARFPANYVCVQRRDASGWHYYFRPEMGGVLKSWAAPNPRSTDS